MDSGCVNVTRPGISQSQPMSTVMHVVPFVPCYGSRGQGAISCTGVPETSSVLGHRHPQSVHWAGTSPKVRRGAGKGCPASRRAYLQGSTAEAKKQCTQNHRRGGKEQEKGNMVIFCFLGGHTSAYGRSQARGQIGAAAAGLLHSQSNARSDSHLRPTSQLKALPDPSPTDQGQGSNPCPHGC